LTRGWFKKDNSRYLSSSNKEESMDLRDFVKKCEAEGELKRIRAEVNWDLELSHISKLNEENRGPALLFEKVKDYPIPVLASAFTSPKRLAIALGMPFDFSMCNIA